MLVCVLSYVGCGVTRFWCVCLFDDDGVLVFLFCVFCCGVFVFLVFDVLI